ncbi:MAG: hypothetical protein IJI07_04715 [Flexilinea sp.]|nr:hypothetical protein [Flexilinea sp.]
MDNKLTIQVEIQPSDSDYAELLSYPDIFALFQNITVTHSKSFKYDQSILTPKGLFWVTARNRIRITRRPAVGETVDLSTWPEEPDRIRGRRNYTIKNGDELLIEGTTEWAILDRNTNRLFIINKLYDPDFEFCREKVLPENFYRFTGDFPGEPFAEYKVRSIDIDFEGHMNNVAYIRALFGLFSRAELEKMDPKEIECHFKVSCYEGDRLLWYKRDSGEGLELCARLENGTDIFFARLR